MTKWIRSMPRTDESAEMYALFLTESFIMAIRVRQHDRCAPHSHTGLGCTTFVLQNTQHFTSLAAKYTIAASIFTRYNSLATRNLHLHYECCYGSHHHWSSVAHGCRLSATEHFQFSSHYCPLPPSGTKYSVMSLLWNSLPSNLRQLTLPFNSSAGR